MLFVGLYRFIYGALRPIGLPFPLFMSHSGESSIDYAPDKTIAIDDQPSSCRAS